MTLIYSIHVAMLNYNNDILHLTMKIGLLPTVAIAIVITNYTELRFSLDLIINSEKSIVEIVWVLQTVLRR